MSAEILREAASLMRERTQGVTASDGTHWGDGHGYSPLSYMRSVDARHVASWHPAVALAVAASLEQAAAILAEAESGPLSVAMRAIAEPLVDVARAYLGGDA